MKELLIIAIGAAVVNNVVLSQFLGRVLSSVFPRKLTQQPEWVVRLFSLLPCLPW